MAHAVILEHTTADGASHFDWMIEDPSVGGERRLRTWRVARAPVFEGSFRGQRLVDHRALYLRFEGDIGGGRGVVRRIAAGSVGSIVCEPERMSATIRWDDLGAVSYFGRADAGDRTSWLFECRGG